MWSCWSTESRNHNKKQLSKCQIFWKFSNAKFDTFYNSLTSENTFKRLLMLKQAIGLKFWVRKWKFVQIRKSKLVDFGLIFHKIGEIFIQKHIISKWFWKHNLPFLTLIIIKMSEIIAKSEFLKPSSFGITSADQLLWFIVTKSILCIDDS